MRALAAIAVLLATVAVALVGVRLRSENHQLERMVWEEMRRRDSLAKQIRETQAEIDLVLAPRTLLVLRDRIQAEALAQAEIPIRAEGDE